MIGTTRSRVSFFMNRFRKFGLIVYNSRIQVHRSQLNVVLLDQLRAATQRHSKVQFPKRLLVAHRGNTKQELKSKVSAFCGIVIRDTIAEGNQR